MFIVEKDMSLLRNDSLQSFFLPGLMRNIETPLQKKFIAGVFVYLNWDTIFAAGKQELSQ
jgi:hypothetical protein